MSASAASSSGEYTLPVGLLGEQSSRIVVRGVMAALKLGGRQLEIVFLAVSTITGFAPVSLTSSA